MSFTTIVKNEVSKLDFSRSDKITELSALVNNLSKIDDNILISTENASVARRIFGLTKDLYDITPKISVRKTSNLNRGYKYVLSIYDDKLLSYLNVFSKNSIPSEYLVDDDDLKRAYIRGAFLACGSINDPKKSRYHLELIFNNENYAKFILNILNHFNLNSKVLKRDKKYMVYIKEAEKISDFLKIISASESLLYFEDIRIYRDHKNMTNRLNNCEQANVDKMIKTASEQLNDIKLVEDKIGLEVLSDKVKTACIYRKKYPDVSMLELSEIISIETGEPITKSGLNHRFIKVKQLAKKIREKRQ